MKMSKDNPNVYVMIEEKDVYDIPIRHVISMTAGAFIYATHKVRIEERNAIVAYLRKGEEEFSDCDLAADLIATGEHWNDE